MRNMLAVITPLIVIRARADDMSMITTSAHIICRRQRAMRACAIMRGEARARGALLMSFATPYRRYCFIAMMPLHDTPPPPLRRR